MNYPRYLRGFTKITVILSIVMFFVFCVRNGFESGFQAMIAVPIFVILSAFIVAIVFEFVRWIYKDFKKVEQQ